jgi:hypothetical protein
VVQAAHRLAVGPVDPLGVPSVQPGQRLDEAVVPPRRDAPVDVHRLRPLGADRLAEQRQADVHRAHVLGQGG